MNVEKNMPLKVRIESQHYWTAGILYQGTLIYELCNIRDIIALDSGVEITGETAGRYHGAAERTRGHGD